MHVVDDREKFANRERFPDAAEVVADDIPAWIARTALPSHAYAVIVTRGHTNDLDALRALAPATCATSASSAAAPRWRASTTRCASEGTPAEHLARVHAPIGLDIGAVTPQEIAVSILAELIAVKHGKVEEPRRRRRSMQWNNLKVKTEAAVDRGEIASSREVSSSLVCAALPRSP